MFIAMNRFRVIKSEARAFEEVWLNRQSTLHEIDGFIEFHMLKGPEREDHILYASYTQWRDKEAFNAWTVSPQFRASHARAGDNKPKTLGPPEFESFEVIQRVAPEAEKRAAE